MVPSVEALTRADLVRYLVVIIIDLKIRRVEIAGIAPRPDGEWMKQIARSHQGLDDEPSEKPGGDANPDDYVECRERLGGIPNYCHRRAAQTVGCISPHYDRSFTAARSRRSG